MTTPVSTFVATFYDYYTTPLSFTSISSVLLHPTGSHFLQTPVYPSTPS